MSELHAIARLLSELEREPRRAPRSALVADARAELDAHRQLSRVLRRLNTSGVKTRAAE